MRLPAADLASLPNGHKWKASRLAPGPEWVLVADSGDMAAGRGGRRVRMWQLPAGGTILLERLERVPLGWRPVAFCYQLGPVGMRVCVRDDEAILEGLRYRLLMAWLIVSYRLGWAVIRWAAWAAFVDIPPGATFKGALRDLWARRDYREREKA